MLSEAQLNDLLTELEKSLSAFKFEASHLTHLRSSRALGITITGGSGSGRITIPKQQLEELSPNVELYSSYVVKNLYEFIGIGMKYWLGHEPAIIHVPMICRIKDCRSPVSHDALRNNSRMCAAHFNETRLV